MARSTASLSFAALTLAVVAPTAMNIFHSVYPSTDLRGVAYAFNPIHTNEQIKSSYGAIDAFIAGRHLRVALDKLSEICKQELGVIPHFSLVENDDGTILLCAIATGCADVDQVIENENKLYAKLKSEDSIIRALSDIVISVV